eukprot:9165551-Ditylum_brightwellii.AAC.1
MKESPYLSYYITYENYDQLNSTQLTSNTDEIRSNFNLTTPVEKYIAHVEKCMDIAVNGGAPFPLLQFLTLAYDVMYCTGLYNKKCLQWEDKPPHEKTWLAWKAFFTKVVHDHCHLCKVAGMNYQANSA